MLLIGPDEQLGNSRWVVIGLSGRIKFLVATQNL